MPGPLKRPHDLIGTRSGCLTVTKYLRSTIYEYGIGSNRRRTIRHHYNCVCDCGSTKTVMRHNLLTQHTISCGCVWKAKGEKSWRWTGYEGISGALWSKIKNHARYRNLKFDLTIYEAWELFLAQDRKCTLTGTHLVFGSTLLDENTGVRTASLDRLDSKQGYFLDNVHWVHKDINQMKMDLSLTRFIELCKAVSDQQRKQETP